MKAIRVQSVVFPEKTFNGWREWKANINDKLGHGYVLLQEHREV